MKITNDSHLDHALTQEQIDYIMKKFGHRDAFFIETVDLPPRLGTVPCGLHGPIMGDEPVPSSEATMGTRGEREYLTRFCHRAPRQVSQVTLIAGPHGDEPCILYTAFGGPLAPKEPGDPSLEDDKRAESEKFWKEHALSVDVGMTDEDATKVADYFGLPKDTNRVELQELLNEAVLGAASATAAEVNNQGVHTQLAYIIGTE